MIMYSERDLEYKSYTMSGSGHSRDSLMKKSTSVLSRENRSFLNKLGFKLRNKHVKH